MTQDVNEVYSLFFDKLERDDDFFSYWGIDEEEAMELARERASSYLVNAISYLHLMMDFDFEFDVKKIIEAEVTPDDEMINEREYYQFIEPVTQGEIDLLTEAMLLCYFERDLAKLKAKINFLASSDLTVLHSPANERTSYVAMLDNIKESLYVKMSYYQARDRKTGKRKSVIDPKDYYDSGIGE